MDKAGELRVRLQAKIIELIAIVGDGDADHKRASISRRVPTPISAAVSPLLRAEARATTSPACIRDWISKMMKR
ncbi:hypothetical protein AOQ73_19350 [Bradyrhizobium pachyrhizi]|uniref:hypothetical protein n=1 Tax=Bradyrhizobium pachyrhizi TaxID=280333 RepID=UPI000704D0DB|nr:hypothetical protein [Bradyrhizobium pachyrhizi]KRP99766.1 hypothetical protein AOQ73_19350 [Bradyrhizobium pachyrhizi]